MIFSIFETKMQLTKKDINIGLKKYHGRYFVYYIYSGEECIYVGSTMNVYRRLKTHKSLKDFDHIELLEYESDFAALMVERSEIKRLQPRDNVNSAGELKYPHMARPKNYSMDEKKDLLKLLCR